MKNIIIYIVFLFTVAANAQHDNIWYFGRWAGLDFNTGIPVPLTNSAMWALEGSSVISDENGNLLFYTNGLTVWNRNHQIMQNGNGLLGNNSTTQAAMIVPKPGQPTHYYIFTPDAGGGINGLHYSEVDMNAAGGLGAVINKNIALVTPVCEKVTAAYHSNGTDIWVTTHHWGSDAYYSYLVTSAGVNPAPVISNVGMIIQGASNSGRFAGFMAISPDGSHLAINSRNVGIELMDFNNSTGQVSNARVLKAGSIGYGLEFSPSGNLIYATLENQLVQYQVNTPNPELTETFIAPMMTLGAIKIGPDSKLYIISAAIANSISVVNKPDSAGVGCDFVLNQTDLGGRTTFVGLPTFLTSPFYITGITFSNGCSGSDVSFSLSSTIAPDTISWDFGDGATSDDANPSHTYAVAGTYTVKATAKKGIFRRFFTQTINILPSPVANQPQDMILCDGISDDGAANFDLALQNAEILGTQPASDFTITYHLSQSDADSGSNPVEGVFINTTNPQTIFARVMNNTTTICDAVTSFELIVNPSPAIEMQDEYFVCDNNIIALTAPAGFDSYQWSTGEATRTIFAGPGNYTLTVFKDYGDVVCNTSKNITVTRSGPAEIIDIQTNDWTDNQNTITIDVQGTGKYEYSIDGITYQDSPVFYGLQVGLYTVYVRDKNGCGVTEEDVALLMYPRFFTPNGDGINDIWNVKLSYFEPGMAVHIMDRYGKLITSFHGNNIGWDGTYNGHNLPSTDYWFVVKRQDGKQYKGHFAMIR